jgi:hypothetical protein
MATTTPNFGWPVPTSTDLVKDGATAIEALGDGVDASFVDLKGGTTGQVLAKTSATDLDFTWVTTDDANAIQNSIVDAKGDLIAASAADTPARLAVGTNGQTIVADSTASTGLKYSNNAPLGGMSAINPGGTALTGATTITVSGLSNLSRISILVNGASSANASSFFTIRLNSDSTANYGYGGLFNSAGTLSSTSNISSTSIPFARQGNNAADVATGIVNLEGTFASGMVQYNLGSAFTGTLGEAYNWSGFYVSSAQITSVSINSTTGNFDAGSIIIYGV